MDKIKNFFRRLGKKTKNLFSSNKKNESNQDLGLDSDLEQTNSSDKKGRSFSKIALTVLIVLIGIFLLAGSVFAVGIYKYDWDNRPTQIAKKTFPFPAAMIGLNTITVNQVEQESDRLNHFFVQTDQVEEAPDEAVMKNQILERLIENEMVKSLAKKHNIKVTSEDVDQQYQEISEQNGGEDKLENLLDELYNLSPSEFKELVLRQLRMEELNHKFDDELRSKIKARHILIKVDEDANKKQTEEARKKAQNVLNKAKKDDADFAKLAKNHSQDKASKDDGGQLPMFGAGDMVESFEEAAYNLEIGEVSDLVETQFGFHIIKVEEKQGEIKKSFSQWIEDMKDQWFVHKFIEW
jgi:foldase protein PrsA